MGDPEPAISTGRAAEETLRLVTRSRLLPVLTVDDPGSAGALGEALLSGGLAVAEVALRTEASLAVLQRLGADRRLCVGAGTVLDADQVDHAIDAGAAFVVSPGLAPDVVRRARERGVAALPGVATPTDLMTALRLGLDTVKLFPADRLGGVAAVSALAAPFPQVRFVPTGGIAREDAPAYLDHPAVAAVGGSWMAPRDLVRAGEWERVRALVADAVALVKEGGSR